MRLSSLLKDIETLSVHDDCEFTRLILDSRKVQSGDLFVALAGTQTDGRQFIADAIARGASAVLLEASSDDQISATIPLVSIPDLRMKLGSIAAKFYDDPAKKMAVFGVTGTSGKTSCTHFMAQILSANQKPCGVIGSLGNGFLGALKDTGLTTPDAITLQASLADFRKLKAQAVAMEVSSHSIDQGRVNGIEFAVGMFTNLSRDHLDYHGTMENYAAVKHRFISTFPIKHAVINADDGYGNQWIKELSKERELYTYSTRSNQASLYADHIHLGAHGIKARVHSLWGEGDIEIPLIGEFNLSNVLGVMTALCATGMPFNEIVARLPHLQTVAGRMQAIRGEGKPLVVVDHAHKPDALAKVLETLRAHTKGRLFCVFGCGGERDHSKRPVMASVAEKWADLVIVTNDNPRRESPETIVTEIMQGFTHPEKVIIEPDRSKAIENSIQWAKAGDCVLIAGKGAEQYQLIGDKKIPFDDVLQAERFLAEMTY